MRAYDSGDRRRTRLRLSSAGQSVYTRVAPLALGYEKKLLDALSPTDRRALDRLVGRLIERGLGPNSQVNRLFASTGFELEILVPVREILS